MKPINQALAVVALVLTVGAVASPASAAPVSCVSYRTAYTDRGADYEVTIGLCTRDGRTRQCAIVTRTLGGKTAVLRDTCSVPGFPGERREPTAGG